jgi:hypothetical protein
MYEIVDSEFEKPAPNLSIARFKTACGKVLEITLEHPIAHMQEKGQKAFSYLSVACEVPSPDDTSDFHGKTISAAAWDIVELILNPAPKRRPKPVVAAAKQEEKPEKSGRFVYVISCQDSGDTLCKIGIARSPEKRLQTLSTSSPHSLRLEFTRYAKNANEIEGAAHIHFANKRRNGEWFAISANTAISHIIEATRTAA